MKTTER